MKADRERQEQMKKGLGANQNLLNEVNEKLLKLVENNILMVKILI